MGRGSYIGGGTIIGGGRRWSDWSDFPKSEPPPLEDAPESSSRVELDQRELLKRLGMSRKSLAGKKKGDVLKQLLGEGVLLPNGQPNPDHPKVQAVLTQSKPK